MKTIDLTTKSSALAYLRSLPPETKISLPGAHAPLPDPGPGDAVAKITGESANQWAASMNRWEWTAGELVTVLAPSVGFHAMGAEDYHGKPCVWEVGGKIMHVTDDGQIFPGTIKSIADGLLEIEFPDGECGWKKPETCHHG